METQQAPLAERVLLSEISREPEKYDIVKLPNGKVDVKKTRLKVGNMHEVKIEPPARIDKTGEQMVQFFEDVRDGKIQLGLDARIREQETGVKRNLDILKQFVKRPDIKLTTPNNLVPVMSCKKTAHVVRRLLPELHSPVLVIGVTPGVKYLLDKTDLKVRYLTCHDFPVTKEMEGTSSFALAFQEQYSGVRSVLHCYSIDELCANEAALYKYIKEWIVSFGDFVDHFYIKAVSSYYSKNSAFRLLEDYRLKDGDYKKEFLERLDGKPYLQWRIPLEQLQSQLSVHGTDCSLIDYQSLDLDNNNIPDSYAVMRFKRKPIISTPPPVRGEIIVATPPIEILSAGFQTGQLLELQDLKTMPEWSWSVGRKLDGYGVKVLVTDHYLWVVARDNPRLHGKMVRRRPDIKHKASIFHGEYIIEDDSDSKRFGGKLILYDAHFSASYSGRLDIVREFCGVEWLQCNEFSFVDGDKKMLKQIQENPQDHGWVFSNMLSPQTSLSRMSNRLPHLYYKPKPTVDLQCPTHNDELGPLSIEYQDIGEMNELTAQTKMDKFSSLENAFSKEKDIYGQVHEMKPVYLYGHWLEPVRVRYKIWNDDDAVRRILTTRCSLEQILNYFHWDATPRKATDTIELSSFGVSKFTEFLSSRKASNQLLQTYPHAIIWFGSSPEDRIRALLYRQARYASLQASEKNEIDELMASIRSINEAVELEKKRKKADSNSRRFGVSKTKM